MSDVPVEFKAWLATVPFGRTAKGIRLAAGGVSDLPDPQLALLRRFTGRTDFELLLSSDESVEDMARLAWDLFRRGLIDRCGRRDVAAAPESSGAPAG